MNTIPLTFNCRSVNYSVLGGKVNPSPLVPVTCILFNRKTSLLREETFENIVARGFEKVICIEEGTGGFSKTNLSKLFPSVYFITALENVTVGDMLNIAVSETSSPYMLILPVELASGKFAFNMQTVERFAEKNIFCTVPHLYTSSLHGIPVNFTPESVKSVFNVTSSASAADGVPTLYAADYAGLYNRDRFIHLGGFDYTISSLYWQKLDFYMRAWLWGEKITVSSGFDLSYQGSIPDEDKTSDLSYLRFYLKNLAPVFKVDHGYIPRLSFLPFKLRSSCGLNESLRQFRDACRWTEENKYRFKTDAAGLIKEWGN
ncbi:MAG: hypothetical protein J5780_00600 [Treponema sp.]|nr:hypothetical protein [Treponema sp.]